MKFSETTDPGYKESLMSSIKEMRYEISRFNNAISDLVAKNGFMLSAASLISIIPFNSEALEKFSNYYLYFVFPFLIIGLITSIIAIRRKFTYRIMTEYHPAELEENIENLQSTAQLTEKVIIEEEKNYRKTLNFYRIANTSISIFLFLYMLNIYSFITTGQINIRVGFKQFILCFIILILFPLLQSKFWSSAEKTRIYAIKSNVGGPTT